MANLNTEFLCEIRITVGDFLEIGPLPQGKRVLVNATGGSFCGPKLQGEVLPGGGDWLWVRPDGVSELDVRFTLRTDDRQLIYMSYRGFIVDPDVLRRLEKDETVDTHEGYWRITPKFETASEKYSWLTRIVAVGVNDPTVRDAVGYKIFTVL
jgi:hypothetical protein